MYFAPRKGKKIRPSLPYNTRRRTILRTIFMGPMLALLGGMPATAMLTKKKAPGQGREAPAVAVPFVRASHRVSEPAFDDSFVPGAASTNLGPYEVPARGFIRSILLYVTASGSTIGPGVLSEDYPFVLFDSIELTDTNGRNIFGPLSGFDTFVVNLFGGYRWNPDPRDDADYVGTINATFILRIPVEITAWDAYGALANQASNQTYRVRLVGAAVGTAFTTLPTLAPTVRVRGYLEAWSSPEPADLQNQPQEQLPPGHGTTQFWTLFAMDVNSASVTQRLPRVGNLVRNWIVIVRDAGTGLRTTADFPDDFTIRWNSRDLITREPRAVRRDQMVQAYGKLSASLPAGVFVYQYTDDQDGHPGNENRHLWLPTLQSDRIEFDGTFVAANVRILTNDVAAVGGR